MTLSGSAPVPRHLLVGWLMLTLALVAGRAASEPAEDFDVLAAAGKMRWAMALGKDGPDTAENSAELLAVAQDAQQPAGVRAQALRAFAAMAARRLDPHAAQEIWALRGRIGGMFDPTFDALGEVGTPALPHLLTVLRECGGRELAKGRLDDPTATLELEEAGLAASTIAVIVERDATATAPDLAAELIRALDCGGSAVRQLSARALGLLAKLGPKDAEAVRKRVARDRHEDVRAFATSLLAAHGLDDAKSIKVLERALADRAEVVRLGAANALVHLKRPARARPTLARLIRSRNQEIAQLAASVLKQLP
jgi:hypothetical protein